MGLKFVEKGEIIVKGETIAQLRKQALALKSTHDFVVASLGNANNADISGPFREGFYAEAERQEQKERRFIDALIKTLEGLN